MPNPGWLMRQFDKVDKEIEAWPALLRRVSALEEEDTKTTISASSVAEPTPDVKWASAGSKG
jgi:hypothetical protein